MSKVEMTPFRCLRQAAFGGMMALALTMLLTMLLAATLSAGLLPEQLIPGMALLVALLSAISGAMYTAKTVNQKRMPLALAGGMVYLLLLLLLRAFLFKGEWEAGPAVAVVLGAAVAGLLASRKKKRRK